MTSFIDELNRIKMKHCHFSLVYNDLPYLKQKLPFLYDNFDQLIFYDLSAFDGKYQYSQDGSHEFIKEYPDPEGKITLIELRHGLQFVKELNGPTNRTKLKMATYANKFIKDNIDVFWTTDMDEFFNVYLMREVEYILDKYPEVNNIGTDHYLFWNNFDTIMCEGTTKGAYPWKLNRIARHKPGRRYSHCDLQERYPKEYRAGNMIYHFSSVGKEKTLNKLFNFYSGTNEKYKDIWNEFENVEMEHGKLYGYPNAHQSIPNMGFLKYFGHIKQELPYIDFDTLKKDIL